MTSAAAHVAHGTLLVELDEEQESTRAAGNGTLHPRASRDNYHANRGSRMSANTTGPLNSRGTATWQGKAASFES